MLRRFAAGFVALLLCIGFIIADEAKGKVKKTEKGTITVTVGDKDHEFKVNKETKVIKGTDELKGKDRGKTLKELKEGDEITVIFEKDGDKTVVKEVKLK